MAHIVIAEDDYSLRLFLKKALEKDGHDVHGFDNGQSAFHHIQKHSVELGQKVRQGYPAIKIIYMTGFNAMNHEMDSPMITKPFHMRDMVSHVNSLLNEKK